MIELKNICKTYKVKNGPTVQALKDVSCKLNDTGLVFVLGKSGSGKSTMLNVVGGLDIADNGEVVVNGTSFNDFSQQKYDSYRNSLIGFIFQEYNVINEFNVGDNIGLALRLQGKKSDTNEINKILKMVDLDGLANRKMNELSGGQKQRVAIARALVKEPEIILADEPTGALDSNTGKQIFALLKKLSKDHLIVVVSHDREFAEYYGDRVIELADGVIISDITKVKDVNYDNEDSLNVKIFNNTLLSIKAGTELSNQELETFKRFVKESKHDIFCTSNEKGIASLKKSMNINDRNESSSYRDTTDELIELTSNPQHKNKKYVYKKNHLPWAESMRVAFSSLKAKPWQLIFTFILTIASFGCFGIAESIAGYNPEKAFVENAEHGNFYGNISASFRNMEDKKVQELASKIFEEENKPYGTRDFDKIYQYKCEYNRLLNGLTNEQIDKIKDTYQIKLDKVYPFDVAYSTNGLFDPENARNGDYAPSEIVLIDEYDTYKNKKKDRIQFSGLDIYNLDYSHDYVYYNKTKDLYNKYFELSEENKQIEMSDESETEVNKNKILANKVEMNDLASQIYDLDINENHYFGVGNFESYDYKEVKPLKSVVLAPKYTEHNKKYKFDKFFDINNMNTEFSIKYGRKPQKNSKEILITDYMFETMKLYGVNQYTGASKEKVHKYNKTGTAFDGYSSNEFCTVSSRAYLDSNKTVTFTDWNDFNAKNINYQILKESVDKTIKVKQYPLTSTEPDKYYEQLDFNYDIINCPIVGVVDTGFDINKYSQLEISKLKKGANEVRDGDLFDTTLNDLIPYDAFDRDDKKFYAKYDKAIKDLKSYTSHYGVGLYGNSDFIKTFSKLSEEDKKDTKNLKLSYKYKMFADNKAVTNAYINYKIQPNAKSLYDFYTNEAPMYSFVPTPDGQNNEKSKLDFSLNVHDSLYMQITEIDALLVLMEKILFWTAFGFGCFAVILLAFFINNSIIYKRREIGILRSLGASGRDIYGIFLNESLMITIASGIIAAIGSGIGVYYFSSYLSYTLGCMPFRFGIIQILILAALMLADGAIASFLPCFAISRQKPIDSIRLK